jgi:hypothetical protein
MEVISCIPASGILILQKPTNSRQMGSDPILKGGSHRFAENMALLLAHQPGRALMGNLPPGPGDLVLGERLARPCHRGEQYPRDAHEIQLREKPGSFYQYLF